jgi:positive regulator of sigma E activity
VSVEREERGVVIGAGGGRAHVRIARSMECNDCHGCRLFQKDELVIIEALDRLGVSAGDSVRVGTEGASALKAALLLFVFPLVLFLAGYAAGAALAPALGIPTASERLGVAVGAVCFCGAFLMLRLFTRGRAGAPAERSVILEKLDAAPGSGA